MIAAQKGQTSNSKGSQARPRAGRSGRPSGGIEQSETAVSGMVVEGCPPNQAFLPFPHVSLCGCKYLISSAKPTKFSKHTVLLSPLQSGEGLCGHSTNSQTQKRNLEDSIPVVIATVAGFTLMSSRPALGHGCSCGHAEENAGKWAWASIQQSHWHTHARRRSCSGPLLPKGEIR